MSRVTIDPATGVLVIDGKHLFPLGLSNPPSLGKTAPSGREGLEEVAQAGVSVIRTGRGDWSLAKIEAQIAAERTLQDAAASYGLQCWLQLGDTPNLPSPVTGHSPSVAEQLLTRIATGVKDHPALAAYKGVDEPRNPLRGDNWIRPDGLVRARQKLAALDGDHPLVIIQAPRSSVAELTPYQPAFDITGVDIFPIAYPPGQHSDSDNRDASVVGDMTQKMVEAAGGKSVWTTLQIAWTGTVKPGTVPCFPSLHDERFRAYQANVGGARGLMFFGGHLTQITRPADAKVGWNWTFWEQVLRPLLVELTSTAIQPALLAPTGPATVSATAQDVQHVTRQTDGFLYVIAVRRGGATSRVGFSGLPAKHDGSPIRGGQVLFEYVQEPPPPPITPGHQVFRSVSVTNGGFRDWLGPHDARVYRFAL